MTTHCGFQDEPLTGENPVMCFLLSVSKQTDDVALYRSEGFLVTHSCLLNVSGPACLPCALQYLTLLSIVPAITDVRSGVE